MTSSQPADPSRHLSVNALAERARQAPRRRSRALCGRDPPHRRRHRRSSMRASTRRGSVEAGLLIARICMGGLGRVARAHERASRAVWPSLIEVHTSQPVLACLGSQYAGWSLAASKEETGGKKFFSLGSGPARALAVQGTALRRTRLPRPSRARRAGDGGRPPAAAGRHRQGAARLRARARQPHAHRHADTLCRRHDAGRRARARGCAAQDA